MLYVSPVVGVSNNNPFGRQLFKNKFHQSAKYGFRENFRKSENHPCVKKEKLNQTLDRQ